MTKQQMLDCIHEEVARYDVVLFMKRTPEAPECGFSSGYSEMREMNFSGELGQCFARMYSGLADEAEVKDQATLRR